LLKGAGMVLGGIAGVKYRTFERHVPGPACLYVVSDGTFEIARPDGTMWDFAEFQASFATAGEPEAELDGLFARVKALHGPGPLDDDFSIVRFSL
jgi:sigma-B regulation protein RsbU (phosphoserine phosphatase)